MVRFPTALFFGRLLPRWTRDRVFDAAYHELLGDYLVARTGVAGTSRWWLRLRFETRAWVMTLDCWRLLVFSRFAEDKIPAGAAPPPNLPPRKGNLMDSYLLDFKYAARKLFSAPAFSATAILIVAIGVGANTAAFSIVNAMLFRPQPFARPGELVDVYQDSDDGEPNSSSFPAYRDMAAYDDLFAGASASFSSSTSLQTEDGLARMLIEFSTSNSMEVLGLTPFIGRWFDETEDSAGGEPTAVLSYRTWQERFAGDPNVLGTVLRLNGSPITVVGVGPEGYAGIVPLNSIDTWLSLSSLGPVHGSYVAATLEQRGDHWFLVKARLRDGVTSLHAQEAMDGLAARLAAEFPEHNEGRGITVFGPGQVRVHPSIDAMLSPSAAFLMTVVGLVLLIACTNLANLLLVRASTRGKEITIRVALGASRGQVARQMLIESVLLSVTGGVFGILLAAWAVRALMAIELPLPVPMAVDLSLDVRVLAFAAGLSVFTGIAFGLAPAMRASRPDLAGAMRDEVSSGAWRRRTFSLRNGLLVGQVAMSFVLLVAAGLFIRSLDNAQSIETGFSVDDVAFLRMNPSFAGYDDDEARNITRDLIERARALPGVEAAGVATVLPVTPRGTTTLIIDGYEPASGTNAVEIPFSMVGEDYFATLRIPLLHGRTFDDADRADAERVAVVSETMAVRYWGDSDAVGRRFRSQGSEDWVRVVGVVGDTIVRDLTEQPTSQMYRPWGQSLGSAGILFARTAGDPSGVLGLLRAEVRAIDAEIPVLEARTMSDHLSNSLSLPRTGVRFLGGFGVIALVLASLGLYGVVSFAVGRRLVEVGVRMALGAQSGQVVWLVLREVAALVGVGIVVGVGLSLAVTGGLAGILFGVSPTDPVTFVGVSIVLLVVAMAAALIPALRAAKADPVLALRQT